MLKQNSALHQNLKSTQSVLYLSAYYLYRRIVSDGLKLYYIIIYTRFITIFQIAWSLPVCQMVVHWHFMKDIMPFFWHNNLISFGMESKDIWYTIGNGSFIQFKVYYHPSRRAYRTKKNYKFGHSRIITARMCLFVLTRLNNSS